MALGVALILLLFSFGLAGLTAHTAAIALLALYLVATTAYSLLLKKIAILDVVTLSGLYTLRIFFGAVLGPRSGLALVAGFLGFLLREPGHGQAVQRTGSLAAGRIPGSGRTRLPARGQADHFQSWSGQRICLGPGDGSLCEQPGGHGPVSPAAACGRSVRRCSTGSAAFG